METIISSQLIPKENIPFFNFTHEEVIAEDQERKLRKKSLFRGMIIGNNFKQKVKITFETLSGAKAVETTIWAVTEKYIFLKGGIHMPINCIHKIAF